MTEVAVMVVMGVTLWWQWGNGGGSGGDGADGLPVECTSWASPPGSPIPHGGCALTGGRVHKA